YHGQFGLQSDRHAFRPGLQQVDPGDDASGIRQNGHPGWRKLGITARAIEQLHANLFLEIADCLAHNRLGAQQLAGGGRKASFIDRGDERAQLIERDGVEHGTNLSTKPKPKRWMLLPDWRSYRPARSHHWSRKHFLWRPRAQVRAPI